MMLLTSGNIKTDIPAAPTHEEFFEKLLVSYSRWSNERFKMNLHSTTWTALTIALCLFAFIRVKGKLYIIYYVYKIIYSYRYVFIFA